MMKVGSIALGTAIVPAGVDVEFTYAVQDWKILIQGIAIAPSGVMAEPLNITLVSYEPDRAEVRRFDDGSTISDMGLRRLSLTAETSPDLPLVYLIHRPDRPDDRWFEQGGVIYLRAKISDRVVVRGRHAGESPAEVSAMLVVQKEDS